MNEANKQLIEKLKTGDRNAFDDIYRIKSPKLYRMAYLISGNKADSEDILQETFVKCFLYHEQIKQIDHFDQWLVKILIRTSWRLLRKKHPTQSIDELMEQDETSGYAEQLQYDINAVDPLEAVINAEFSRHMAKQIQSLQLKHRTVVVLYYYQDLSIGEIAKITGSLEGTVKSRLYTARKKLKEKLTALDVHVIDQRRVYDE